jgi:hypothetical protein
MENRAVVRYRLGVRAVFCWDGPVGSLLRGEGITRDVSRGGVFIFSAVCPAVDSTVRIDVFRPPLPEGRRT